VLPGPQNLPTSRGELGVVTRISRPVTCELLTPPFAVRSRKHSVFLAPVPEAAIDEHHESEPYEHDVGATRETSVMQTKPNAASVEFPSQRQLGSRVPTGLTRHAAADMRGRGTGSGAIHGKN